MREQNMQIIEQIKNELLNINNKYINDSKDNYDFWNMHIKFVVEEAIDLAKKTRRYQEVMHLLISYLSFSFVASNNLVFRKLAASIHNDSICSLPTSSINLLRFSDDLCIKNNSISLYDFSIFPFSANSNAIKKHRLYN